jgi:uncharacterized protein (TIGR03790 family)
MAWICAVAVLAGAPVHAQTPENVAVVINDKSPVSQRVGEYYVKRRGIPAANVIRITAPEDETVNRQTYLTTIEGPIAAALSRSGLRDRVLYVVLTKGIPLRVEGTAAQNGTVASVDSELTLLYRRMVGTAVPVPGRVDNPYFLGDASVAEWRPFSRREHDIYLVTRLDAFTEQEAIQLVDRGMAPVTDGRIVLDMQARLVNRTGEDWLEEAAARLRAGGHAERVLLENTPQGVRDIAPVIGYYSWGSNDPRNRVRSFGMGFVPGSLAAMFVSSDGRTFREPPPTWTPSDDSNRSTWHAGTPQSLMADLIREGATGVAGHVAEPNLQSSIRPEVLFPVYLAGANLVEAFYAAMPHLSWQTIVVGDPLCAPFRKRSVSPADIDGGIDQDTLLPAFYSRRRIAHVRAEYPKASERAVTMALRGEVLLGRGEIAAGRQFLEQATALSPQLVSAQLLMVLIHEQAGEHLQAIERYRRIVDAQPGSVVALNNLAYRLATVGKNPKDALPFATAAAKLAPQDPAILDTLAWTQHLLGDNEAAVKTTAQALKFAPNHPEIRLHAAIIYAAAGARAVAEDNLRIALKLNPGLADSPDVAALRATLEKLGASK